MVGLMAALVQYFSVVAWVDFAHLNPLIANILGFLLSYQVSFLGHRFFTFAMLPHQPILKYGRFFLVASLSFSLNECLYAFALHVLHWHYRLALMMVILTVSILTYILSRCYACR